MGSCAQCPPQHVSCVHLRPSSQFTGVCVQLPPLSEEHKKIIEQQRTQQRSLEDDDYGAAPKLQR